MLAQSFWAICISHGQFAYQNVLSLQFATSRHWQIRWILKIIRFHGIGAICISQRFVASVCHQPTLTDSLDPQRPVLSIQVDLTAFGAICISQRFVASVCHQPPLTDSLDPQNIFVHISRFDRIWGNLHISQRFVASVCHKPPLADIGPPRNSLELDPQSFFLVHTSQCHGIKHAEAARGKNA